jgi:hypothetical protein
MPKKLNLVGQKFGRLEVIAFDHMDKKKGSFWKCKCNCIDENYIIVSAGSLRSGNTKSCGCIVSELITIRNKETAKHNRESLSRLHSIWKHMIERCEKDYSDAKKYYQDKGIIVCNEWHNYFIFKEWAINNGYNENLTIDRINNNGNYEPSNCRWITILMQQSNKSNNHFISINGRIETASEWERISGIGSKTILYRLKLGWKDDELLSKPYELRDKKKS